MPKRTVEEWFWENPRAQDSFLEYVGFDDEQKSAEQVVKIEKLLGLSPCKGLDVECGNGRQTAVFARRGYGFQRRQGNGNLRKIQSPAPPRFRSAGDYCYSAVSQSPVRPFRH